jgi:hypothetical protein
MAKEIPIFISEEKLFADQLTATWQAIALNTLLAMDGSTNKPKSLFNIGDLTEISGGSMVNNIVARNDGQINVYDSDALAVGSTTWEALLSAGVSLLPPNFITGFVPEYVSGTVLSIGGGSARSSDDTTNLKVSSLGQKSLMSTWDEGFGASVGSMVGGGAHYSEEVPMTGAALPSGEMCFATGNYSSYYPYEAFDQTAGNLNNVWYNNVDPATINQYLGRKNNIGVVKRVMLQSVFGYPYTAANTWNSSPEDFEIVGTNDTITDQSSFNAASWTTLLTVSGQQWSAGLQKKYFEIPDNTTNWAWIGIKITKANGATSAVGLNQMMFSTDSPINEIKPMTSISLASSTLGIHTSISYHVFVLYNPISTNYDWCVDTFPDGRNILSNSAIASAGYTKFRRVFSFTGNADSEIVPFYAHESDLGNLSVHLKGMVEVSGATDNQKLQFFYTSIALQFSGTTINDPFVPKGIMIKLKTGLHTDATTTSGSTLHVGCEFEQIFDPVIGGSDYFHSYPSISTNSAGYSRYVVAKELFETNNSCFKISKNSAANQNISCSSGFFIDYRLVS